MLDGDTTAKATCPFLPPLSHRPLAEPSALVHALYIPLLQFAALIHMSQGILLQVLACGQQLSEAFAVPHARIQHYFKGLAQ